MKKLKLNKIKLNDNSESVPTPVGLKWKAEKYNVADAVQTKLENLILTPTVDSSSSFDRNIKEENKLEVKLKWNSEPEWTGTLNEKEFWAEGMSDYGQIYSGFLKEDFGDGITTKLPTKLIDVRKIDENDPKVEGGNIIGVVKNPEADTEIKNYAILSYSWGFSPWAKFRESSENPIKLFHAGSQKSFRKAIKACRGAVKINYLWMDVLCISQDKSEEGIKEREKELAEVRRYYSGAKVTLIAIQEKVQEEMLDKLKKGNENLYDAFATASEIIWMIHKSEWFKRSWTFQEGLLSRQTIFMFDNCLIDGRLLAMVWSTKKDDIIPFLKLTEKRNLEVLLKKHSLKATTPLGWSYYHDGYVSRDAACLNLFQALEAIKERKRYITVDCIYSITGLLPYKVKPDYKKDGWGVTKRDYDNEEDIAEALIRVIKVAVQKGYGEPFSWYGESSELPGLCWLPKILIEGEKNGLMRIEGAIKDVRCEPDSVEFLKDGEIKIKGFVYEIGGVDYENENITGPTDKLCKKKLSIKTNSGSDDIELLATNKVFKKIVMNDEGEFDTKILVPSKIQWKSDQSIALLVRRSGENRNTFHRIDLVRMTKLKSLTNHPEEDLIIGMSNPSDSLEIKKSYFETRSQIEISPKKQ